MPRGFTLVESLMATLVIGGLAVAVLNGVGGVVQGRQRSADRERAVLLASRLMNEICARAYADPDGSGVAFGVDTGESASDRAQFDDVDDYDGYDQPPAAGDDKALEGATGLGWRVAISQEAGTIRKGVKLIVVEVYRGDGVLARLSRMRSSATDDAAITTYRVLNPTTMEITDSVEGP
jgi:MSHA pilin protein MshD